MKAIVQPRGGRFQTVTAGIVKAARPGLERRTKPQIYLYSCLMLALGQCAQDVITEFSNLPSVRGKYRANKMEIASAFAQQRKKVLRGIPNEDAGQLEAVLCEIVDNCEARVRWLIASVRDELTQKIDYRAVEPGALLGIAHGIVQCCNRINELMAGRTGTEYNKVLDELADIDDKIGTPLLNEGVLPDREKCVSYLVELIEDMKRATLEVLGLKRCRSSHDLRIEKGGR